MSDDTIVKQYSNIRKIFLVCHFVLAIVVPSEKLIIPMSVSTDPEATLTTLEELHRKHRMILSAFFSLSHSNQES